MRSFMIVLTVILLAPSRIIAGMSETLKAIQESEFSFSRADSKLPFYPVGWAQDQFYPRTQFDEKSGNLPNAAAMENTIGIGAVLPAHVAKRDMELVGIDLAWDSLDVRSGPYADQSIFCITPVAAWLHKFGENETLSAFAAPIISKEFLSDQPWGVNGYGGVIGMHRFSDDFRLLYGGVYQYSFGQSIGYPYLGTMWMPTPNLAVDITFPWPAISYAPHDRWLLQLMLSPGGSSWVSNGNGYENTESLGSWNLTAGAAYRLHGKIWLYAGAGLACLRGIEIEGGSGNKRFESKPGPVFTLALQFRP